MPSFSEATQRTLAKNPHVSHVTPSQVQFTSQFKLKAVQLNLKGQSPSDIFCEHGIDTSLFRDDYPKKSVSRWKKIYLEHGEAGLREERRGKSAIGRPKSRRDQTDRESLLTKLAYLEAENFILKKLHALAEKSAKKKGSK